MAPPLKRIIMPTNLGKGVTQNGVTKLFEVCLSTDAGNGLAWGSDNGLWVPIPATVPASSLVPAGGTEGQILMWKGGKPTWVTPLVAISVK